MGARARAVGGLLAVLAAVGCGRGAADKIHGWPPPADAFRDTIEPPDTEAAIDTAPPSPEDTVEPDHDALPSEPCAAVVELACRFYGPYGDDCHEARTRVPDGRDPEARDGCEALVARFTTGEDATSFVNPCRRYARVVCKELGSDTRACQQASAAVASLASARQKRACLGDLLMFAARGLRR